MTTTDESLEAMTRANFLRASRASSSMHPSWLDAAALQEVTRVLKERQLKNPPPDWLIELWRQEEAEYEATLAAGKSE